MILCPVLGPSGVPDEVPFAELLISACRASFAALAWSDVVSNAVVAAGMYDKVVMRPRLSISSRTGDLALNRGRTRLHHIMPDLPFRHTWLEVPSSLVTVPTPGVLARLSEKDRLNGCARLSDFAECNDSAA
jgi:hypothetical protein